MSEAEAIFVDTNVFLRFLTGDDPAKAEAVRQLFQRAADGEIRLTTSLLVVAEIVWTLESFYGLDKAAVAEKVEAIVAAPYVACPQADRVLQALDFYVDKNVDFIDAYHAFLLREDGPRCIATYDEKHFRRAGWLQIVTP